MTEKIDLDNIPEAAIVPKKRMRFSVVWIIPIVAALVAIGIAVQRILSEGPTITIVFKAAEGDRGRACRGRLFHKIRLRGAGKTAKRPDRAGSRFGGGGRGGDAGYAGGRRLRHGLLGRGAGRAGTGGGRLLPLPGAGLRAGEGWGGLRRIF